MKFNFFLFKKELVSDFFVCLQKELVSAQLNKNLLLLKPKSEL